MTKPADNEKSKAGKKSASKDNNRSGKKAQFAEYTREAKQEDSNVRGNQSSELLWLLGHFSSLCLDSLLYMIRLAKSYRCLVPHFKDQR